VDDLVAGFISEEAEGHSELNTELIELGQTISNAAIIDRIFHLV